MGIIVGRKIMAIKVLHIVTYMGRGGLETMIMNYYRKMDKEKIQFDFLVHRDFEADYDDEIKSLGGNIYNVPMLNPFSLKYYNALDEFFSKHDYDIVHSHLDCLSAYPLKVAKKYGVKVRIAHAHNKNQDKNLKYLIKMFSKRLMPYYATDLFACSEEAGSWMFPHRKFTVMKNAIEANKYTYAKERELIEKEKLGVDGKFVIGHIGRFNPQKNHEFIIDIFENVVKKEENTVLLLVGTGDGEETIRTRVKNKGLEDKVIFLGSRGDVPDVLQAMNVFLFPSKYEGLGIAAVEAQAAGIPCVLSTQVPRECKLCENVEFVSLKLSADEWAQHILRHKDDMKKDAEEEIAKKGFDIIKNVEWLEQFYIARGV